MSDRLGLRFRVSGVWFRVPNLGFLQGLVRCIEFILGVLTGADDG